MRSNSPRAAAPYRCTPAASASTWCSMSWTAAPGFPPMSEAVFLKPFTRARRRREAMSRVPALGSRWSRNSSTHTAEPSKSSNRRPAALTSGFVCPCASQYPHRMKRHMQPRALRTAAYACALYGACAWVLSGCIMSNPKPAMPAAYPAADTASIEPLLTLMSELPKGDPARQAELFQSAKDAAALSPTTSNRLRYALALATPGHGGSDPVAAQRQLSELLARPETLLTVERLLALVELQEVDRMLVLQAENKRLRDDESHDSRDKLLAANRRLQAESDENAKLRKALDEARAKLDAITHIEGSINNRGAADSHTP